MLVATGTAGRSSGTLRTTRACSSLLAALAAAALLGAGSRSLLTRRALRPLTTLSAGARAIGATGDADAAAAATGAADEVGELAETLNAMLASLERAREAERRFVGRRLARAAHAADRAARQRRLHRPARRRRRRCWPTSRPTPSGSRDLLDDLLALAREDAAGAGPRRAGRLAGSALAVAGAAASRSTRPRRSRCAATRTALERAHRATWSRTRRHGPADGTRRRSTVRAADGRAQRHASATRARAEPASEAEHAFERFWRAPGGDGRRARASASRSSRATPSATAAACRVERRGLHDRAARSSEQLSELQRALHIGVRRLNRSLPMKFLRTPPPAG